MPQGQPKRGRLSLNDGSCNQMRPEYPGMSERKNLTRQALPWGKGGSSSFDDSLPEELLNS